MSSQTCSRYCSSSHSQRTSTDTSLLPCSTDPSCNRCIGELHWILKTHEGLQRSNDRVDHLFAFKRKGNPNPNLWEESYQTFIHDAHLVPVHSHNDYTRHIPLFEALASGCISVEADVHLKGGDLLIGHTSKGLRRSVNLRRMYLGPLELMLGKRKARLAEKDGPWQGLFDSDTKQTLVLLIDQKSAGPQTFAELHSQLQPLRDLDYLTYWNGTDKIMRPITIVASGKAPFDSIMALPNERRDIFYDAPLETLPSIDDDFSTNPPTFKYNISNSHYASTEYVNAVTWRPSDAHYLYPPTPHGRDMAGSQIEHAASRGLLTRYWGAPTSPPNLRDAAWRHLTGANVGLLNMDDLGEVRDRARGWGRIREPSV
jgi:hypothetical protein